MGKVEEVRKLLTEGFFEGNTDAFIEIEGDRFGRTVLGPQRGSGHDGGGGCVVGGGL